MCNCASYSHVNRCQVFNYNSCLFPMSLMGAASLTRELPHQPATHPPFQLSNNFAHFALWILLAYWSKVSRGFCTSNSVFQGKLLTDLWATHPTFQMHQYCTVCTLNIAHSKDLDYLLLYSKCSVTWQTFGCNSSRLSAAPTLHILLIAHIPYILLASWRFPNGFRLSALAEISLQFRFCMANVWHEYHCSQFGISRGY